MVTIDLKGGQAAAYRTFDRLQIVQRATSLGGVESLAGLPVLTSHFGLSDEDLARAGVTRGMVRISVGLEDAGDLIADLRQAIE
jgi:cystathionine beta-lyase/cystathionine gamma-synthase